MLILLIKRIFLCFLPPNVDRDYEEPVPTIVGKVTPIDKATPSRACIDMVATTERISEEVEITVEREYVDTMISIEKLCKDVAVEEQSGKELVIPPTKSIDLLDDITQYHSEDLNRCKGCNQIFSSDFKRLAFQSSDNPCLCIGCKGYKS